MQRSEPSQGADPVSAALRRLPGGEALVLLALAVAAITAAFVVLGGLSFPFFRDEVDYWEQTQEFLAQWPPGLDALRSYGEPMTPLSFLLWGVVERTFGGGLEGLRLCNAVLSLVALGLIGWRAHTPGHRALLAGIGLLIFPYWVGLSVVLYTDMPAVLLVLLGLWLYARGRGWASAAAFALAIATRQYAVTFPAALVAAEVVPFLLRRGPLRLERVLPMGLAAATLLGWIAFFGGLGPRDGLEVYPTHMEAIVDVTVVYGLYFLSCVGAYFVLPEILLFRRWREPLPPLFTLRKGLLAAAFLAAYAVFPPPDEISMGPLNRAALVLFPPEVLGIGSRVIRGVLFAVLAWMACLRFARFDVIFWLVALRAVMMTASWESWEKYNTSLIAALWYLRSISDLRGPIDLWRLDPGAAAPAPPVSEPSKGSDAAEAR